MSLKSRRHISSNAPLTGTSSRMQTLPHINISSIDHHQNINHPLIPTSDEVKQEKQEEFLNESSNRKCVYTYEDKYTFARILTNDSLVFDSHFESGNLHSAFRVQNNLQTSSKSQVYDLYLHNDVNTNGHTQWFYFSVSNCKAGLDVTFVIRNFSKPDSLYGEGMRPLIYSVRSSRGWERCGSSVCYFSSNQTLSRQNFDRKGDGNDSDTKKKSCQSNAYIMCFTHIFEFSGDVCYFAYCQPYTYTDLQRYLDKATLDANISKRFRRSILCKTNAGNNCDLLTITAPAKSPDEISKRITVVLTSRVHPGESNASWIMQGILDVLLGNSKESQALREKFIFKVIPMLNPDGVINGNYRTSLSGCDLNRRWHNPDPIDHPTIYYAKELIRRLTKTRTVGMMMDIHGHSQRQGVFIYGCVPDKRILRPQSPQIIASNDKGSFTMDYTNYMKDNKSQGQSPYNCSQSNTNYSDSNFPKPNSSRRDVVAWRVRLLPRIFDATIPIFSFDSCSFKMHRAKSSTMRMVAFTELGVDCVYTIEASLAGKDPYHFSAHDLLQLGKEISFGILTAYPSMAPKVQESQIASPNNNNLLTLNQHSINLLQSLKLEIQRKSPVSPTNLNFGNNLIAFYDEMLAWRKFYDPSVSIGRFLISDYGMYELYGDTNNESKGNDSDIPLSIPLPPQQYKNDSNTGNKSNYEDSNTSNNDKLKSKKISSKNKKVNDEKDSNNDKSKSDIPRPPSNQQKQNKHKKLKRHEVITTKVEKNISKVGIIQSSDNSNNLNSPEGLIIVNNPPINSTKRKSTTLTTDIKKLLLPNSESMKQTKSFSDSTEKSVLSNDKQNNQPDPFKNVRLLSQQTQHVALDEVNFKRKGNEKNDSVKLLPTKYLSPSNSIGNMNVDTTPGIVIDSSNNTIVQDHKNKPNAWILFDSTQKNINDNDYNHPGTDKKVKPKRPHLVNDEAATDSDNQKLFVQSRQLLAQGSNGYTISPTNKPSEVNKSYRLIHTQYNLDSDNTEVSKLNNKPSDNDYSKIDEDANISLVKFIVDSVASVKGHKITGKVYLNDKSNEFSPQILSNSSRQIRTAMNVFNDGQAREFSVERNTDSTIKGLSFENTPKRIVSSNDLNNYNDMNVSQTTR